MYAGVSLSTVPAQLAEDEAAPPDFEVPVRMEGEPEVVVDMWFNDTVDDLLEAYVDEVGGSPEEADGLLLAHCTALPPGSPPEAEWLKILMPMTKLGAVLRKGEPVMVMDATEAPLFTPPSDVLQRARSSPPGPPAQGRLAARLERRAGLVCGLLLLQAKLGAPLEVLRAFALDAAATFAPQSQEAPEALAERLYEHAYSHAKITAECRAEAHPRKPFCSYEQLARSWDPVACGLCATIRRPGAAAMASFIRVHLAAGFSRLYLFFEEGEDDEDLVALREREADLLDQRVVVVPCDAALDAERREACRIWWERYGPHVEREIQARQILNTMVALRRAEADALAWLLHLDCDEAFVCDRPVGEHFGALTRAGLHQVHYVNREAQLEAPAAEDPFREVTLFKKNPLEGGPPFHAYQEGKAAVSVAAVLEGGARPVGSIAFAGLAPGRSATFDPSLARVLHYPYASREQFARKYAWRQMEQWNTHLFHRRCLEASKADARAVTVGECCEAAALFREVLGTESERLERLKRGQCVRDASVAAILQ
uniref:Glycosyltransferase family 92 protein n=1 Tax=Alexandrium monilatum TaxID=311494 RepID=A0A7S4QS38_9DINO